MPPLSKLQVALPEDKLTEPAFGWQPNVTNTLGCRCSEATRAHTGTGIWRNWHGTHVKSRNIGWLSARCLAMGRDSTSHPCVMQPSKPQGDQLQQNKQSRTSMQTAPNKSNEMRKRGECSVHAQEWGSGSLSQANPAMRRFNTDWPRLACSKVHVHHSVQIGYILSGH